MYSIDEERMFWRKVGSETIILDIQSGYYFQLDDTGSVIWEYILKGNSPEEIAVKITDEFDVDYATALKDAKKIISSMEKEEIIKSVKKT